MNIIPAIDIMDGQCVRLEKGDFSRKTTYSKDPLTVAKTFEDAGIKYLHLVDLDGARLGKLTNLKVVESIARHTSLQIDFGGGISSLSAIEAALDAGARKVTIGSMAVHNPSMTVLALEQFGAEQLILGADIKAGKIAIAGWKESDTTDPVEFALAYSRIGFSTLISTAVSRDGMLAGPDLEWYKLLIDQTPFEVIASGGVHCMEDLFQLKKIGCAGAIIGKAIYEGAISLSDLKNPDLC